MRTYRNIIFILVTVFAILIQLANPTLVRADDGTPPPPAESETEVAPPEEPVELPSQPEESAIEAAPAEEPAELSVATEAPAGDVAPVDDPNAFTEIAAAEGPTMSELIEQIPEQTDIVVLDETGQVVPLATQEAADIIITGDPIWCPDGVNPGGAGCSPSYNYFTVEDDMITPGGLIGWLSDVSNAVAVSQPGKIWIADSYNSAHEFLYILVNGTSVAGTMENFALTLQGGWDGAFDSLGTITVTNSLFFVPITITNWTGAVTVNNITVANPAGTGLSVTTAGNIELNNINVTGSSTGFGAYLDNTSSPGSATVTVGGTNNFNGNYYTGLNVWSNGNITANNVTANNNQGHGAFLNNLAGMGGTVSLTGSVFNNNDACGLWVDSAGDINLNNIIASNSVRGCGAQLDSEGNINLNNITASNNHFGVWLDNCNDSGSGCQGWGDVTLTGTNVFDDNQGSGLFVISAGNITLENLTANRNALDGVYLENWYGLGVTLSGTNTFNDNGDVGLEAYSDGNITLENLTANRNAYYGIYVGNLGDTALNGVTASDNPVCNIFVNCECLDQDDPDTDPDPNPVPILSSPDFVDLVIDCSLDGSFLVQWASGDQIVLSCVDGGTARLWRMDNTMLPGDMPAGFEYASGFLVEIFQDGIPLDVLTDEGFIQIGFASRHENPEYRIVYWDEENGDWIPLKDIQQDAVGGSVSFPLHSSNPQDVYKVLRGASLIVDGSRYREEVTTNFPGLFVLAQK